MNNELGRTWKEEVTAYLKALYFNLPGGADKNHKIPQSEQVVPRLRFKPQSSGIQTKGFNLSAVMFGPTTYSADSKCQI
jgi:hypothetical protein